MADLVSRGVWGAALLGLGVLAAGCNGKTPRSDIPPPDLDKITVFYPVDGLVRGRGLPDTFPPVVTHVLVRAHPTGTSSLQPVQPDGSFVFSVIAISGDLLEVAGTVDDLGNERGDPIYVRVPPTPLPAVDYVCCEPTGTCQDINDAEEEKPCPDSLIGTACEVDQDCGVLEGEYLTLDLDRVQVTSPNEKGRIDVTGVVEPNALVILENRGLTGVGIPGPRSRQAQISSDVGGFALRGVQARGDDELVLKIRDLIGFSSPAVSRLVPDAELAGLDIVGAFAWEPLTNGARGPIAIHMSPFGVDGRGICPDTDEAPEVCYSGGLSYSMVTFNRAQMRVGQDLVDLNPAPTSTAAGRPHTRGREGDVRSATQDIVVVVDVSDVALAKDGGGVAPPQRFAAIARFIEGMRARDRVGLVTYGGEARRELTEDPDRDTGLVDFENRSQVTDVVLSLASRAPVSGNDLFGAIEAAAKSLRIARSKSGRIVVIAASAPTAMTRPEAVLDWEAALGAVGEDLSRGDPRLSVDAIGIAVADDAPNLDLVRDITTFTDGRYYSTSLFGIEQSLTDVRSFLSGSFILLYDVDVPLAVGKSGTIELDIEVILGAQRGRASYTGPLRILNSSNN